MCRQKKKTFVHKSALPTDVFRTHRHTHTHADMQVHCTLKHCLEHTNARACLASPAGGEQLPISV